VASKLVELHEGAWVEQRLDAFARGELATLVLGLHRSGRAGVHRFVQFVAKLSHLSGSAVQIDVLWRSAWVDTVVTTGVTAGVTAGIGSHGRSVLSLGSVVGPGRGARSS
jgi:hypothetical protein